MRGRLSPNTDELTYRSRRPQSGATIVNNHSTAGIVEHADLHCPERTGHNPLERRRGDIAGIMHLSGKACRGHGAGEADLAVRIPAFRRSLPAHRRGRPGSADVPSAARGPETKRSARERDSGKNSGSLVQVPPACGMVGNVKAGSSRCVDSATLEARASVCKEECCCI